VHTYALHAISQQHFEGPVAEHAKSEHPPPGSEEQQQQPVSPVIDDSMPVLSRLRHVYDFVHLQPPRSTGKSASGDARRRLEGPRQLGRNLGARRCYGPEAQHKGRTCSTNLPSTVRFSNPSMPGGRQPAPASRRSL